MEELSDVKQQRELLEQQLNELRQKQWKMEHEANSLVCVDNVVFITNISKYDPFYKVELPMHKYLDAKYANANKTDTYFPCLVSEDKEVLATEMLRFSQRLIDAALQLRQIEG